MGNVTAKADELAINSSSRADPTVFIHECLVEDDFAIVIFLSQEGNRIYFLPDCRVSVSINPKT